MSTHAWDAENADYADERREKLKHKGHEVCTKEEKMFRLRAFFLRCLREAPCGLCSLCLKNPRSSVSIREIRVPNYSSSSSTTGGNSILGGDGTDGGNKYQSRNRSRRVVASRTVACFWKPCGSPA